MADNAPAPAVPAHLEALIRHGTITVDPERAAECCGIRRDDHGYCQHRPGHPVYVPLPPTASAEQFALVAEDQGRLVAPFGSEAEAAAYARDVSWDEEGWSWWNVHRIETPDPERLRRARLDA